MSPEFDPIEPSVADPGFSGALEADLAYREPVGRLRGGRHLWIMRRLGLGVLVLLFVSVLVFAATQALPGDAAHAILGPGASPARVALLRRQLGLDRPLVAQYLSWLGDLVTGDLGKSLVNGLPVSQLIGSRLVNSVLLVSIAALISIPLALVVGAWSGARRDRAFDHGTVVVTLALTALPDFVIGLILIIFLSTVVFHVLPALVILSPGQNPLTQPTQLILPVACLVLATFPYVARLLRGSVIDAYESEYVRMARLKGAPESVILRRHVLPNALVPALQGTAITLAYMTGGIVVIETLFNYPGLGSELASAVSGRDLPQIQAIVLIFAAAYVLFNLVGDVLTIYATPRLRTAH